jgi:SLT domain-containing protein
MRGKISLLAGGAIGYVLGTRAGRERYEQIRSQAQSFWNNPKVQEKASQAQDLAKEKAPLIKDKVSDKVSDSGSASASGVPSPGQHRDEHAPYPTSASTGLS